MQEKLLIRRALRRTVAGPLILAFTLVSAGCVRQAAKQATKGTLDAVKQQVQEDQPGRAAGAPGAGPRRGPQDRAVPRADRDDNIVEPVARSAVEGSLEELNRQIMPLREVTREAAAAAASGALLGAVEQREAIARIVADASGAAGHAFARTMAEELRAQIELGLGDQAALPGMAGVESATSRLARGAATSAVAGVSAELARELTTPCTPDDPACLTAAIQRASRAIAMGAAEGVERKTEPWPLVIAFVLGALLAAGVALLVAAIVRHRQPAAPETTAPTPPPHAPIRQPRHLQPHLRPHPHGATP